MDVNYAEGREYFDSDKEIRAEIENKTGKTPAQLFEEREKRLQDAVALKTPDRVPVVLMTGYFPFRYAKLQNSMAFYDQNVYRDIFIKTLLDFPADAFFSAYGNASGKALEILGDTQSAWAGGPYPDDQGFQFFGEDIIKDDEYDLFITDPSDFLLRYYLPRRYKALAPLEKLSSLMNILGPLGVIHGAVEYNGQEIAGALQALAKAGEEQVKFRDVDKEVSELLGIPEFMDLSRGGGLTTPPYHQIVDYLRGLRCTLLDMYKRPEKLLAAMDSLYERSLARADNASPEEFGKIRVMAGGNHFSSEEFLSRKQFDTFVWPTWKKCLLGLIERGFIPRWLMEGKNDDRIEPFLDLPKGKAIFHFEKADMHRAKDILKDHMCIAGNVPVSLLWGGSPQEVEDYCRDLIEVCGKDGGFILANGGTCDDAKPENLAAMINAAEKYGRYY